MAREIKWFNMETKEERQRKQSNYFKRMFPLGEKQQEAERELLHILAPGMKAESAMYQLVFAKEVLYDYADDTEEEQIQVFLSVYCNPASKGLSQEELLRIFSLAQKSKEWKSIEDIRLSE